jgi:hypothetical protein
LLLDSVELNLFCFACIVCVTVQGSNNSLGGWCGNLFISNSKIRLRPTQLVAALHLQPAAFENREENLCFAFTLSYPDRCHHSFPSASFSTIFRQFDSPSPRVLQVIASFTALYHTALIRPTHVDGFKLRSTRPYLLVNPN